ncbi:MAG: hypothetical protein JWO94_2209 [Verrucomicrobiaceae bacterium]|nr:hypothetical protein [Verrucomicrobiaceae bacterium]
MRLFILFTILVIVSLEPASAAGPVTLRTYTAGEGWTPIEWRPGHVLKGSALDFSSRLETPAGRHGEVICRDGRFVFKDAPDKPVKFYGTVISHSLPYQDKKACDEMTAYLAASGYSAVRLHCYCLGKEVMKGAGAAEFTPEARDQLDYFFNSLKQRGIYYTLQINSWAFFKAGDAADVPEFSDKPFRFESSGLLPISQDLQKWFKAFSLNLFTHVNPYTGMALKDDPAMISIELENESSILAGLGQHPELMKPYTRLCREHLASALGHDPTPAEMEAALPMFALDKQAAFNAMACAFLRENGVRQPLTNLNFRDNQLYALPRSAFDYVDIHAYWALYRRQPPPAGSKPGAEAAYTQTWLNPVKTEWTAFLGPVAGRLWGRPYLCTEYNGCYPTPYWSFVGPVESVLAATQEWGGIFRCGPAPDGTRFFNERPVRQIGFSHSPQIMFSERIGALLYSGNEVKPLPDKLPWAVTPEYLRRHADIKGGPRYPDVYTRLAFDYQLGTLLLDGSAPLDDFPCLVVPPDMELPASLRGGKVVLADAHLEERLKEVFPSHAGMGGLQRNTATGSSQMITPGTETFLLSAETASAAGVNVSLTGNHSVATCFAGSLDGRPLAASRRVLALYLTDLKNTGTEVEDPHTKDGRVLVRNAGQLPLLLETGRVTMQLKHAASRLPKVWALKWDGSRAVAVEPRTTKSGIAFDALAVTNPEVFFAFEVAWEDE